MRDRLSHHMCCYYFCDSITASQLELPVPVLWLGYLLVVAVDATTWRLRLVPGVHQYLAKLHVCLNPQGLPHFRQTSKDGLQAAVLHMQAILSGATGG